MPFRTIVDRKRQLRVVIVVQREPHLPQIVRALRPAGRLAGGLNRRQQQRHQHADNRDHDEQFDERKAVAASHERPKER